jgi:hypothetical protein
MESNFSNLSFDVLGENVGGSILPRNKDAVKEAMQQSAPEQPAPQPAEPAAPQQPAQKTAAADRCNNNKSIKRCLVVSNIILGIIALMLLIIAVKK